MQYLYVRVVKARDIALVGEPGLVCEVKLGNIRGLTKTVALSIAEWDQVFAFSKDCIQSSLVEIFVKESDKQDYIGQVWFDLSEVPNRGTLDSQLAPQWYKMEDNTSDKAKTGELMISTWFGTQADEAYAEAWHSGECDANECFDGLTSINSKVYLSPKLWYLRVSVIEAQDIMPGHKGPQVVRFPEFYAKVQVENQIQKTRIALPSATRSFSNPYWNEDLFFVIEEPFGDYLSISVEDQVESSRAKVIGKVHFPVAPIEKRTDGKPVTSRWFNLDSPFVNAAGANNKLIKRFVSKIKLQVSFDGGYHVHEDEPRYRIDARPTEKSLWRPHIGMLEIRILSATGLIPAEKKEGKGGGVNAYCIAKYGKKWVRTRTVVDSLSPKWNEQYIWEVYDPCTEVTIGVFDNCRIDKNNRNTTGDCCDYKIGKARITLSMLETNRVYTHSYPLLMLHPSGVKKMGELNLAVRLSCAKVATMLHKYTVPLLPKMHYEHPLGTHRPHILRLRVKNVVASRLSSEEPPLDREVVEYMLGNHVKLWSIGRSHTNFLRIKAVLSGLVSMGRWLKSIRNWEKPVNSALFLMIFLMLLIHPKLIIPAVLFYMAFLGIWNYRFRPRDPPHMDTTLLIDELDEEFDTFPTSCSDDIVRMRYDRLRGYATGIQNIAGDMAILGERCQAMVNWRDPRATFLVLVLYLVAAVVFYFVPIRVVVAMLVFYSLRPPRFRSKLPSRALTFLGRLPSREDYMM